MEPSNSSVRRCAIYTRKSSEEGLEQNFNSLHAQREACEAFIKSQAGEGWRPVKVPYDDGGLSGASMERPGLQRLLADIREKLVDIVVVYKVDRLTRSLADFAKMVEVFDGHGVSFVSVTQQFNTTTSMGRLTLNVLLSFAQFEREVTGERIRDKIAASKKKGIWMGGTVPLGYDWCDRRLVVNPVEAATVRTIFERYLRLRSVRLLKDELSRDGVVSKVRVLEEGQSIRRTTIRARCALCTARQPDLPRRDPPPESSASWSASGNRGQSRLGTGARTTSQASRASPNPGHQRGLESLGGEAVRRNR